MSDQQLVTGWGSGEPIDDSVLRRFVFNQADTAAAFACGPAARHHRDDDVALADSGGPVAYTNMAVLLRPVTRADDPALDTIADFYAAATGRRCCSRCGRCPTCPRAAGTSPATPCSWCGRPGR